MSLKYRIAIVIFFLELILVSVLVLSVVQLMQKASAQSNQQTADVIEGMLSDLSRYALITGEFGELQPYFERVQQDPLVFSITLEDRYGVIVASTQSHSLGDRWQPPVLDENHFLVSSEIGNAAGRMGRLNTIFSQRITAAATRDAQYLGFFIAVTGVAIIGFFALISGYALTRRLTRLTDAAEKIGTGNLLPDIDVGGTDEVGKLALALKTMGNALKKHIDKLAESEEKFKALADTSPLAIYMSSGLEEKAEYVNPTFLNLFGYTIDEIPDVSHWFPLAYPDENYRSQIVNKWQKKVEKAIATKSDIEPMETVVRCKDGSDRTISWGFTAVGKQNWTFGLDLTERRQVDQTLREESLRLAEIIRGTDIGTWKWNIQTGKTMINRRWAEIIGYTLTELEPISIETRYKFVHPDDLKKNTLQLEKHFKGETDYFGVETRMKHKDGHWVWVLDQGKVSSWTAEGNPVPLPISATSSALKKNGKRSRD